MLFDIRMTDTRGHVPVDVAHVVTGLVFPNFGELHALSAEDGLVLTAECGIDQAASAQFDEFDLAENFAWDTADVSLGPGPCLQLHWC
jgi:hypothetical protein